MTRTVDTYIEFGVRMAHDDTTAAWVFELPFWGYCGQGASEDEALSALVERLPSGCRCEVVERVYGDEQAFARDHLPAIAAERDATLAELSRARSQTVELIRASPPRVLDWDDSSRQLPSWACWRTLRQMSWHLADTESRYYLPMLGLVSRPRAADLITELNASAAYVATGMRVLNSG